MADEEKVNEAEPEQEPQSNDVDVDSKIQAAIQEVQKQFKSEISGLNRRNSELEKELESERKAKMSETERYKFEKEAAEKRAADLEARQQEYQTEQMITAGLAAKEINVTVKSLMKRPETAEDLVEWVNIFNKTVESEVERRVNQRLAGKTPESSPNKEPTKNLQSFADGKAASEDDFLAYLKQTIGE